jgi:hypothetical protein
MIPNKRVTLELNHDVFARARDVAKRTQRNVEDVLADWLSHYASDLPVETLSDDQVLELCRFRLNVVQQQELSTLLYNHRVRELSTEERTRLDELLQIHRHGLVRKARAIQVAQLRGLIHPRTPR